MNNLTKKIGVLVWAVVAFISVSAQQKKKTAVGKKEIPGVATIDKAALGDTSSPKMVTITSAFKPSLQSAAKVNFIAATPVIDSSKIPVVYTIPSQNLFFSYKPVAIKPLALNVDSTLVWQNDQYIKLGAGNFSSFLGEAAFSFGDGKNSITNLKGNFITSTGNLPAQQASKLGVDVLSIFHTGESLEWNTHAYYQNSTQYLYGYQPATLPYKKEDILQQFNTVGVEAGFRNSLPNAFGITFHPQVNFIRFSDNNERSEYDVVIKAPVNKVFSKFYSFDLGLMADLSATSIPQLPSTLNIKNNLYYVQPALQLTTPNLKLHLGIQPTWDNGIFTALPELTADAKISDVGLSVEAGWTGYYQKNTYRSLATINPWINGVNNLLNTRTNEQYIGLKGSSGSHFTYSARLSLLKLTNTALFVNDLNDGKSFDVLFEPEMKALRVHAEVGYTVGENLSLLASTSFTQYSALAVNQKAWGLLPVEMTGTVRWKVLKDLQVKADVFVWDGSPYRTKTIAAGKADPVADINLGAEFSVLPRLNLWLQMNNMLNTAYQRWNQYPVLGFTVLGGVVYSFR